MQILEVYTQGCAALTLGCLTLSALTGLILRLAISHVNSMQGNQGFTVPPGWGWFLINRCLNGRDSLENPGVFFQEK